MGCVQEPRGTPGSVEKRAMGFLEKMECTNKIAFFQLRTESPTLKLSSSNLQAIKFVIYSPDLGGLQLQCGMNPVEFPAVFTYRESTDRKDKIAGDILSIEFVPKSFVLAP